jgi:hypothetical protein
LIPAPAAVVAAALLLVHPAKDLRRRRVRRIGRERKRYFGAEKETAERVALGLAGAGICRGKQGALQRVLRFDDRQRCGRLPRLRERGGGRCGRQYRGQERAPLHG